MNAISHDFLRAAAQLGENVTRPYPNSRKVHVQGSRPDLRVPMREISQYATPTELGVYGLLPFCKETESVIGVENRLQSYIRPCWRT